MNKQQLVSIITPLYNGERFVGQTIESVLRQTYPHWEMIVVNDGSRDNGPAIVEHYANQEPRIALYHQSNQGSASARNNAIGKAQGRYIAFLDADDLWDANFLEEQLRFMAENNAAIACASCRRIDEENVEVLKPFVVPFHVNYYDMLKSCSLPCLSTILDKSRLQDIYFQEDLRSLRDDYVLWLKLVKQVDYAYGNPKVITSYRLSSTAATANKWKVVRPQYKVYRNIEKLGLLRSLYYLICWAYYGFKKYRR